MVGIVIVSHNEIGKAMLSVVRKIIPDCRQIVEVPIDSDVSADQNKAVIQEAVNAVQTGEGVIILTDMFGGTPTNLCLPFISEGEVEVISGLNLPMLIKLASTKDTMSFAKLPEFIRQYGQKNIVVGSKVLDGEVEY